MTTSLSSLPQEQMMVTHDGDQPDNPTTVPPINQLLNVLEQRIQDTFRSFLHPAATETTTILNEVDSAFAMKGEEIVAKRAESVQKLQEASNTLKHFQSVINNALHETPAE